MKAKLPDKPSALIRIAIGDLQKARRNPAYVIDMDTWHEPKYGSCHVCFAGAVIAFSLNSCPYYYKGPLSFINEVGILNKLRALNAFRLGNIKNGCGYMGFNTDLDNDPTIPDYEDAPDEFIARMAALANTLEQNNL